MSLDYAVHTVHYVHYVHTVHIFLRLRRFTMLNPRLQPGGRHTPKLVPSRGTTGRLPAQSLRQISLSVTKFRTLPIP